MKKILSLILAALLIAAGPAMTVFAKPEWPSDTGIQSESGIVMDMDSQTVLFGQMIHQRKAPSSLAKLMTALVAAENCDLSDKITFSYDAVYNVAAGSGNKLVLEEGDVLSAEDCLYALLLQSSNQSANALAEYVAGSQSGFVDMMNQKARELGCEDTHFTSPSGLDDEDQYTTAYDMALIAKAAYENQAVLRIGSARSHKLPATKNNPNGAAISMEHKLLTTKDPDSELYYPAAAAGKPGFSLSAGQTLVTYAEKGDRRLIAVILGSRERTYYSDTIRLLDFGFNEFKNVRIAEQESAGFLAEPVKIGRRSYGPGELSIEKSAVATLPKTADLSDAERSLEEKLPDGRPDGAIGILEYKYNAREIGRAYIFGVR